MSLLQRGLREASAGYDPWGTGQGVGGVSGAEPDRIQEIAAYLHALTEEGGQANRLVLRGGSGWAVFLGMRGEPHVDLELAANAHLPEAARLSEAQLQALRSSGFIPPSRRSERRHQVFPLGDEAQALVLARKVADWMAQLYGASAETLQLQLQLGNDEEMDNTALWAAMRVVSRDRTHEARMALYRELINATFLLAVEAPSSDTPALIERMGPWAVFAAFTDPASLHAYDPRGVPFRRLYGHELFTLLMRTPVGSLKINPDGDVGGELYRNEIETLAHAVRRFYSPPAG